MTGNPRLGWATLVPWCILSLLVFLTIDWEKGRREAGRSTIADAERTHTSEFREGVSL